MLTAEVITRSSTRATAIHFHGTIEGTRSVLSSGGWRTLGIPPRRRVAQPGAAHWWGTPNTSLGPTGGFNANFDHLTWLNVEAEGIAATPVMGSRWNYGHEGR
jgi:hypothetical protein